MTIEAIDFSRSLIVLSDGSTLPIMRMCDIEGDTTLEADEAYTIEVIVGDGVDVTFTVYSMEEDILPRHVH